MNSLYRQAGIGTVFSAVLAGVLNVIENGAAAGIIVFLCIIGIQGGGTLLAHRYVDRVMKQLRNRTDGSGQ